MTSLCAAVAFQGSFMVSFVIIFLHLTVLPVTWLCCAHCSLRGLRSSLMQCSAMGRGMGWIQHPPIAWKYIMCVLLMCGLKVA